MTRDRHGAAPQPDDAARLAELGHRLVAPDLDPARAARIAWHARQGVGHGLSPWRFAEPAATAALVLGWFVWALLRVLDAWPKH